jgi:hypothetical protein
LFADLPRGFVHNPEGAATYDRDIVVEASPLDVAQGYVQATFFHPGHLSRLTPAPPKRQQQKCAGANRQAQGPAWAAGLAVISTDAN